jgi:hypothetical protein
MAEPLIQVTSKVAVPAARFAEWLAGTRPLPGQDDDAFFFAELTARGMLGEEQAAGLLARHRRLLAAEKAPRGEGGVPPAVRDWLVARGWQPPVPG